jgi:endonuclease-3
MNLRQINEIFYRFHQHTNEPITELKFKNEYTLLVAIVLSAQATDISVNKATETLFEQVTNPLQMLKLGEENLQKYIKSIGLYRAKASNILKLSKILYEQYNSLIPATREELMNLPGVGRKTANVFLNCARGETTIGVDTHVLRVSNRLGFTSSINPLKVEQDLESLIPAEWKKHAHHWLILHGRYICKARTPLCKNCYLTDLCKYYQESI